MKNTRKKDLRLIRKQLLKINQEVILKLQDIQSSLEDVQTALEEQYDNLSERSQDGEAGERIQDDISDVEYIVSEVRDIAESDAEDTEASPFSSIFELIDDLLEKEY